MLYSESVLAGLVGPVTNCRTVVAPLRTGIVPWSPVTHRGKSRTEDPATPATEFAALPSEPVVRFRPRELGGKLPRKLLHGPLSDPLEPDDPAEPEDPADPDDPGRSAEPAEPLEPAGPADWAFAVAGTSRAVDRNATGTLRRSEVKAGRRRMKETL